jgi:hypothetical protein
MYLAGMIDLLKKLRRRHGALLTTSFTVTFYVLCAFWIWWRRGLLQESFRFPLSSLWLPLVFGLLVVAVKPWRHRWLLQPFVAGISYLQALLDRLGMTALKVFLPWVVGDPYGYLIVGRRLKLENADTAKLWLVDKWLTLAAIGIYMLFAALLLVWPAPVAACCALAFGALLARMGIPGLHVYPLMLRVRLLLLSLVQEGLHIAGFIALLACVLDGGLASIRGYDVMLVHLAGMLPTLLGGAGSREAATLVMFAGQADDRVLFLTAFLATLCLRVLPSLPGIFLFRRWRRASTQV